MMPLVKSAAQTLGGISRCFSGARLITGAGGGETTTRELSVEGERGTVRANARLSAGGAWHTAAVEVLRSFIDVVELVVLEPLLRCCAASRCPSCVSTCVWLVVCGVQRTTRALRQTVLNLFPLLRVGDTTPAILRVVGARSWHDVCCDIL
jgi:hypothetical protein